ARTPLAPRRGPVGVLARLVAFPEREVARILFAPARLLLLDLVGPLAREPSVGGEALDTEVDVAVGRIGEAVLDELLDEGDDRGDVLGHLREVVRHPEPEVSGVLEVPGGGTVGELSAGARGGVVDLVV